MTWSCTRLKGRSWGGIKLIKYVHIQALSSTFVYINNSDVVDCLPSSVFSCVSLLDAEFTKSFVLLSRSDSNMTIWIEFLTWLELFERLILGNRCRLGYLMTRKLHCSILGIQYLIFLYWLKWRASSLIKGKIRSENAYGKSSSIGDESLK